MINAAREVQSTNECASFVSPSATSDPEGVKGIMLSLYYTPMAIGGIIFCVVGSSLLHIVPIKLLPNGKRFVPGIFEPVRFFDGRYQVSTVCGESF